MVFTTAPGLGRRWRTIRQAALALLALAIAHHAVYLVRYGRAAEAAMHGDHAYWPLLIGAAAVAALVVAAWWGWRLTLGARSAAARVAQPERARPFGAEWLAIFGRLFLTVASAFLALENAEHLLAHGHLDGIGVYWGPGAELTLPAIAVVVGAIALLGALVRWQERAMIARLRARRATGPIMRPQPTRIGVRWTITAALIRHQLLAANDDRGRAPPRRAAVTPA
jgi:hypothetical protein